MEAYNHTMLSGKPQAAHNRLRNAGFSQLPVMQDDQLVGVVTEDDIIRVVFGKPELMTSPVREAMQRLADRLLGMDLAGGAAGGLTHAVYIADQATDELYELFAVPLDGGFAFKLDPAALSGRVDIGVVVAFDTERACFRWLSTCCLTSITVSGIC